MLFSGVTGSFRDSRKIASWLLLLSGVTTLFYAVLCAEQLRGSSFFGLVMAVGVISTVFVAFRTIFDYKIPYEIMDMKYYSDYASYLGIFSSVPGLVIGLVVPIFYAKFEFYAATCWFFIASAVFMALAVCFTLTLEPYTKEGEDTEPTESKPLSVHPIRDFLRLFSCRDFRVLLIPNLLRGVGMGLMSIFPLIIVYEGIIAEENLTLLSSASYIGVFVSSFLYIRMVRKWGIPMTGFIGGVMFCFVLLCTSGNLVWLMIAYIIVSTGNNLLSNAMPNMIYLTVTGDIISQFHTWRLALSTLGTALSTAALGMMIGRVDSVIILGIGALGMFICMLSFLLYYRKRI